MSVGAYVCMRTCVFMSMDVGVGMLLQLLMLSVSPHFNVYVCVNGFDVKVPMCVLVCLTVCVCVCMCGCSQAHVSS